MAQKPLSLMPLPQKIQVEKGKFRLTKELKVAILGNPNTRLYDAASRMLRRLDARTGLFFKQGFLTKTDTISSAAILFEVKRAGEVKLHEIESYNLVISEKQVKITAETDLGAIHAIETLLQLLAADKDGYYFPTIKIEDTPRFAWRGLLLDVCRHWMPMSVVKRNLDCMALVKMNVLHLHLSEDQAFRMESKKFPKLQELASDGNYFTQDELREIVKYAGDRGIRVIPEFDMPAHATAMLVAYPELSSLDNQKYELIRQFGVFDGTLDPTKAETYQFVAELLAEAAAIFPDEYMHIGGDENNGVEWKQSTRVKQMMKEQKLENLMDVQTVFNRNVFLRLKEVNKKMMGWDEILQPNAPQEILIQSWRGKEALYKAAKQGYQSILSSGYYIDLVEPTDKHYNNDPIPAEVVLSEEEAARILGGEATMWAEHITEETVDSRIWPRTAAIAERFWSPREVKDVEDMYRRLETIELHLEWAGSTHLKNKAMLMRRLANGYDTKVLETLVDVVEPMKGYSRNENGTMYSVFSPYTMLADIATPDAKVARNFRNAVSNYIKTPTKEGEAFLRKYLRLWKDNHHAFEILLRNAPALQEASDLSLHLSEIAQAGLEALDLLAMGQAAPMDWRAFQMQRLKSAKTQGGRCELQVVSAIEELVRKATY